MIEFDVDVAEFGLEYLVDTISGAKWTVMAEGLINKGYSHYGGNGSGDGWQFFRDNICFGYAKGVGMND